MEEKDFVKEIVEEIESIEGVKMVEIVPVCEIYIDACLKVVAIKKEIKREVADKIIEVANRKEEKRRGEVIDLKSTGI
ncbi:MAG: hypothetical protein DSZ26_03685 [Thermovibrio sp.]|nr:MAG: hypothetical protein DSZ26_03685 [Thermovibrio sp.]